MMLSYLREEMNKVKSMKRKKEVKIIYKYVEPKTPE
jgi:hypothetical protein